VWGDSRHLSFGSGMLGGQDMAGESPESRFSLKDRWKVFWFGFLPMAIIGGILFTVVGYRDPRPRAWHPIIGGIAIAAMFAGLLAAMLWAAISARRTVVLFTALAAYYAYRHGWGRWETAAVIVFLLAVLLKMRGGRERS
jgi:hypothetical protein